jgi:hypothetical protein
MKTIHLVASGDLRLAANQTCWAAQKDMEDKLAAALKAEGCTVKRAHPFDRVKKHGFIDSQKMGIEVFRGIDPARRALPALGRRQLERRRPLVELDRRPVRDRRELR